MAIHVMSQEASSMSLQVNQKNEIQKLTLTLQPPEHDGWGDRMIIISFRGMEHEEYEKIRDSLNTDEPVDFLLCNGDGA